MQFYTEPIALGLPPVETRSTTQHRGDSKAVRRIMAHHGSIAVSREFRGEKGLITT
jgi:hypothetical protein